MKQLYSFLPCAILFWKAPVGGVDKKEENRKADYEMSLLRVYGEQGCGLPAHR